MLPETIWKKWRDWSCKNRTSWLSMSVVVEVMLHFALPPMKAVLKVPQAQTLRTEREIAPLPIASAYGVGAIC